MSTFVLNHLKPYDALTKFVETRPLQGKTVLITGAGRGVGEHIARAMASAGSSRIGIVGRDKTRIEAARDRFTAAFPSAKFEAFSADITDEDAFVAIFAAFGVPGVLINNAGHFPDTEPFIQQDLKSWWSGFEINILGTANVTQKFLQALAASPRAGGEAGERAVVLNVSSMAAHMRFPLVAWSGYNGSKMGQARIFESLRFEHPDVRFVNIHPGQIESDGFAASGAPLPPGGMTDGGMAGQFYAWAATKEADFLSGRFAWAEWDIEELKAKKGEILEKDLLLMTGVFYGDKLILLSLAKNPNKNVNSGKKFVIDAERERIKERREAKQREEGQGPQEVEELPGAGPSKLKKAAGRVTKRSNPDGNRQTGRSQSGMAWRQPSSFLPPSLQHFPP
ncbi:hypothetical protein B0H67DRAFT_642727 [Lasiosphaeris hirsuta]|uniref:NAD(P)-binding protein n=1 Tax=Lasiosphaeris hirsuta TaxID=260670 RepID=A0AA40AP07_9PEZI|nr:hypothetical protein B0H67DRAFT_642727 [Lasiosphaeris hirsuta]